MIDTLLKDRDKLIDEMNTYFKQALELNDKARDLEKQFIKLTFHKYGIELGAGGTHVRYKKTGEIGTLQWVTQPFYRMGDIYENAVNVKHRLQTTLAKGIKYYGLDFYPLTKSGKEGTRCTNDTSYRFNDTIEQFIKNFEVVEGIDICENNL